MVPDVQDETYYYFFKNSQKRFCQALPIYFEIILTDTDMHNIDLQVFAAEICEFGRYLQY
jgi:hypothetical protein